MRRFETWCAVAVVMVAGIAYAADKAAGEKGKAKPLRGSIVKVDGNKLTLKVFAKDKTGEEKAVATDDKTEVTIDGKAGKMDDLKEGLWAHVTPPEGTAVKVEAFTPKPKKAAEGAK